MAFSMYLEVNCKYTLVDFEHNAIHCCITWTRLADVEGIQEGEL